MLGNQRKLPYQMPVVSEHKIIDQNRAGSSRSDGQYANRFGKSYKCSRKSEALSPELIWSVPDMFSCLDSLGATVANDAAPYDRIGYSESSFDRVSIVLNSFSVLVISLQREKKWLIVFSNSLCRMYQWMLETVLHMEAELY